MIFSKKFIKIIAFFEQQSFVGSETASRLQKSKLIRNSSAFYLAHWTMHILYNSITEETLYMVQSHIWLVNIVLSFFFLPHTHSWSRSVLQNIYWYLFCNESAELDISGYTRRCNSSTKSYFFFTIRRVLPRNKPASFLGPPTPPPPPHHAPPHHPFNPFSLKGQKRARIFCSFDLFFTYVQFFRQKSAEYRVTFMSLGVLWEYGKILMAFCPYALKNTFGGYTESISAYIWLRRISALCFIPNHLQIPGKYLNVFGEYAEIENIFSIEKIEKPSHATIPFLGSLPRIHSSFPSSQTYISFSLHFPFFYFSFFLNIFLGYSSFRYIPLCNT